MRDGTSLVELGRQLIDEARDLIRKEIELAKEEVRDLIVTNAIAAGMFIAAGATAFMALIILQIAIILTFNFSVQFIVAWSLFGLWLIVTGLLVFLGRRRLKFEAPEKTISTIKGDIEWAKGQLRSNGRS